MKFSKSKLLHVILIFSLLQLFNTSTKSFAAAGDSDTYFNLESNSASNHNYAVALNNSTFNITDAITMEAWVYPTNSCTSIYCHIIRKEENYTISIYNGTIQYAFNPSSGGWGWIDSGVFVQLNTWQHIAISRAANTNSATVYLNGRSVYTGVAGHVGTGSIASNAYNMTIGSMTNTFNSLTAAPVASTSFIGSMDEIKIWNTARTQVEIQSDMNTYGPTSNSALKIYYDFNDISGGQILNKAFGATSGTTLTIKNSPVISAVETSTVINGSKIVTFNRNYLSANGWKPPMGITNLSALVVGGGGGGGAA